MSERTAEIAQVLAKHRVNYHHRNVGPEPVTADNLRYTSCEGCDWLGGHRDEQGWEQHIAALLTPLVDVETACEVMHDAYELAALGAGWETQERSRKPWADVPEANKATMRAAVSALLDHLRFPPGNPCDCDYWHSKHRFHCATNYPPAGGEG